MTFNLRPYFQPFLNLYFTFSYCFFRYAQKAWLALEASETRFTMEEINLYGPNGKPDWFLELTPTGTVPVLVLNGGAVVITSSDGILTYYEGEFAPGTVSLFPKEQEQAIRQWRTIVNDKLLPVGKESVLAAKKEKTKSKELDAVLSELESLVVAPYLAGPCLSTADCHAFPFLWRLHEEYGLTEYPKLNEWITKCSEEDPFQKTLVPSWWWWW
jgi:glutathione S-transferase